MNMHLVRRLLLVLGLLTLSLPAQAVVWCHDYTIYRLTGEDPRPLGSKEAKGSQYIDLRKKLEKLDYASVDITGLDAATVQERLRPGDVIVVGVDHSAYVNADGGIDHFIQDPREHGDVKYAAEALPPGPLYSENGPAIGGLFLDDTYADFLHHRGGKPTTVTLWHQSDARRDEALEAALARAKAILAECEPIAAESQKVRGAIETHQQTRLDELTKFLDIFSDVEPTDVSGKQIQSFADSLSLLSQEVEGGLAGIEKAGKDLTDVAVAADALASTLDTRALSAAKEDARTLASWLREAELGVRGRQSAFNASLAGLEHALAPGVRLTRDAALLEERLGRARAELTNLNSAISKMVGAGESFKAACGELAALVRVLKDWQAEILRVLWPFRNDARAKVLMELAKGLPTEDPPTHGTGVAEYRTRVAGYERTLTSAERILKAAKTALGKFKSADQAVTPALQDALGAILRLSEAYARFLEACKAPPLDNVRALLRSAHFWKKRMDASLGSARDHIATASLQAGRGKELKESLGSLRRRADEAPMVLKDLEFDAKDAERRGKELEALLGGLRTATTQAATWAKQVEVWVAKVPSATPEQVRAWQKEAEGFVAQAVTRIEGPSVVAENLSASTEVARKRMAQVGEARETFKVLSARAELLKGHAASIAEGRQRAEEALTEARNAAGSVKSYAQKALDLLASISGEEAEGRKKEAKDLIEAAKGADEFKEGAGLAEKQEDLRSTGVATERTAGALALALSTFDARFSEKPIATLERLAGEKTVVVAAARSALARLRSAYAGLFHQTIRPKNTFLVPNVMGKTVQEAAALLAPNFLLAPQMAKEAPSDPAKALRVIAQAPLGGTSAPVGSTVAVTINPPAKKEEEVTLPKVVGMKLDKAKGAFPRGIVVAVVAGMKPTDDPDLVDVVILQSPPAGSRVAKDSQVTLTYNPRGKSKEGILVPNFVGMKAPAAKAAAPAGLVVTFDVAGDPPRRKEDAHRVLDQDQTPGSRVPAGTVVALVIYGPAEEEGGTVPDVQGLLLEDAVAALEAVGMSVGTTSLGPANYEEDAGRVSAQDPSPGQPIPANKAATLTYFGAFEEPDPKPELCDECDPGPACICMLGVHHDECPATLKSPDPPPHEDEADELVGVWTGTATIVRSSHPDIFEVGFEQPARIELERDAEGGLTLVAHAGQRLPVRLEGGTLYVEMRSSEDQISTATLRREGDRLVGTQHSTFGEVSYDSDFTLSRK